MRYRQFQSAGGAATSTKKFSLGQRVLANSHGSRQPGTIIGLGRSVGRKVWFVELDQADPFGERMVKAPDRKLDPLPPEQDPRLGRSMR